MASYGFGPNNKGWYESKKHILGKALKGLIDDMENEGKFIGLARGQKPYVQVDDPTRGVLILNVSYLTKEFQYKLIERANRKFRSEADSEGYVQSNSI
jgi:hypothetical protein